jgi:hypothetical protein
MKDNIMIILSVVAAIAIASAIILPFVVGNVKLNYEQTTPTFLNTDYDDTANNRTSYFIPAQGKNQ